MEVIAVTMEGQQRLSGGVPVGGHEHDWTRAQLGTTFKGSSTEQK